MENTSFFCGNRILFFWIFTHTE
uniref:Uncharacterized protein n=1 Tax=Arundo donax TaxID=35708 RepID=A0A0A9B6V9_ARUDO